MKVKALLDADMHVDACVVADKYTCCDANIKMVDGPCSMT